MRGDLESLLAQHHGSGGLLDGAAAQRYAHLLVTYKDSSRLLDQRIGPYRVLRLLGSGGMGEVWLAEDTRLDRQVALKLLPALMAGNPDMALRLTREARAASRLNHPNILTIYDVSEHASPPFIASEYVEGISLRQRLRQGPLPVPEVVQIACQVADGVSAAHKAGIVHRDIKPENIMLRPDGRVKVLDFGIAKRLAPEQQSATANNQAFTAPGTVLGTALYMSPEQALGGMVDARADLWSIGIVLYEMVAGQTPFTGSSVHDVLVAIQKQPTPALPTNPGRRDTGKLSKIINQLLQKDPDRRYPSAKALSADLEAVTPSYLGLHKRKLVAASVLLTLVGLIGLYWRYWAIQQATASEFYVSRRLTSSGNVQSLALSPNGRFMAYVAGDPERLALWLKQIGTDPDELKVPPSRVIYEGLAFSPDGQHLYYVSRKEHDNVNILYRVPLVGGVPLQLSRTLATE